VAKNTNGSLACIRSLASKIREVIIHQPCISLTFLLFSAVVCIIVC